MNQNKDTKQNAFNLIIQAVLKGQSTGIYSLEESAQIYNALNVLKAPNKLASIKEEEKYEEEKMT
jgi:hypothetical protein